MALSEKTLRTVNRIRRKGAAHRALVDALLDRAGNDRALAKLAAKLSEVCHELARSIQR